MLRWIWVMAALVGVAGLAGGQVGTTHASDTPVENADDHGIDVVPYAIVQRSDGTYRRMLIDRASLEKTAPGGDLPDGTRILMETYYSPGRRSTVFHKERVDGKWLYGSFPSGRPSLDTRNQMSCLSCHTRAAATDFTFTLPSIWQVAEGGAMSDFRCERGGRSPCPLDHYTAILSE